MLKALVADSARLLHLLGDRIGRSTPMPILQGLSADSAREHSSQ